MSIELVPDTCFGISRILDPSHASAEFLKLREAANLTKPLVVIQANESSVGFCEFLRKHHERFSGYQFVALPVGPVLGDREPVLTREWERIVSLPFWPAPLLLAELIANAVGVVGMSLHLAITALSYGVPVFRPRGIFDGKFSVLQACETVHAISDDGAIDADWFEVKLARRGPDKELPGILEALDRHWDTIAKCFSAERPRIPRNIFAGFENRLPRLLEMEASFADEVARSRAMRDAQSARDRQIAELTAALAQRELRIGELTDALDEREQQVHQLTDAAGEREQRIAQLEPLVHVSAQAEQLSRIVHARNDQVRAQRQSTSWKVTAPLRWIRTLIGGVSGANIVRFGRLEQQVLSREPYDWAFANGLFAPRDAQALVATYPRDHFKTVKGYDGEKGYEYESRPLIHLGAHEVSYANELSSAWNRLARDLLSPDYRAAVMRLTGRDLMSAPMEAYVCHFGPGAWLGPHLDLKDKMMTHVFYFNENWDPKDGGCLNILRSSDMADSIAEIAPIVGNSSVLVRSDNSWHAVTRVVNGCRTSRRSMNVIFYRPGAVSTMWPPGETSQLHDYVPPEG